MRNLRFLVPAGLFALTSACRESLPITPGDLPPAPSQRAFAAAARVPLDVPAVRMDLPPALRPWDTSATALADAVARGENYAIIAVKEPGSARALQTGVRAAVTAASITTALGLLRQNGIEIIEVLDHIGALHVRIAPASAAALRDHPLIDFIEPRQRGDLAAQTTPWGISMVRAPEAWTVSTGSGAKIEIIDTGHQQGHEDLPLVPNLNCAGMYGGCDDGNGHGTHVLGIATARDNSIGVIGVGKGINATDVYVYGACMDNGSCALDEITAGINAGIFSVDMISMSIEGPFDAGGSNAVAQAWANNIVLVAAAGNNGGRLVRYPANYTNVIGVSGVNADKSFANPTSCVNTSNWGPHVDLAAPFTALSTYPTNTYDILCGTSMATPHVSGAAALLRAKNPTWTNQQIVDRLFATAEDRGVASKDEYFGWGIVDAAKAIGVPDPPPPQSPSVTISGPTRVKPNVQCSWMASASGGAPPYSFKWFAGALWVGDGAELLYTNQGYDFTLTVQVTDAAGASASGQQAVSVLSTAPTCLS